VYICNTGIWWVPNRSTSKRIPADFHEGYPDRDGGLLPHIGAPSDRTVDNPDGSQDYPLRNNASAPNAMTFHSNGSLFAPIRSGASFQIENVDLCSGNCPVTRSGTTPLWRQRDFPPLGANGIAFSSDEKSLFIANTGDDRILRMDLETKKVEVFPKASNGADGIASIFGTPLGRCKPGGRSRGAERERTVVATTRRLPRQPGGR